MKKIISMMLILTIISTPVFASRNNEFLEYSNVNQWHKLGYNGKGVTIVIDDVGTNNHDKKVYEVIKLIAPEANILMYSSEGFEYKISQAIDNNAQILNRSLYAFRGGYDDFEPMEVLSKVAYDKGILLNGIAGNGNKYKETAYFDSPYWFTIGSAILSSNTYSDNYPLRVSSSSYGEGLDVMGFTSFNTSYGTFWGTSCATAYVSGLTALFQQRFKEQEGRFATVEETKSFIYENCEGMIGYTREEVGRGFFKLPKLDLKDEVKVEKENPLAVKAIRPNGTECFIHIDFVDKFINGMGYRLSR